MIYKNDVSKWKRFANSLRLRLAVRLTEVDQEKCIAEANAAISSPAGLISDKADNAYMPPKADGSWGQDYNYTMVQITWSGPICMAKSVEKLFANLNCTKQYTFLENAAHTLTRESVILFAGWLRLYA